MAQMYSHRNLFDSMLNMTRLLWFHYIVVIVVAVLGGAIGFSFLLCLFAFYLTVILENV